MPCPGCLNAGCERRFGVPLWSVVWDHQWCQSPKWSCWGLLPGSNTPRFKLPLCQKVRDMRPKLQGEDMPWAICEHFTLFKEISCGCNSGECCGVSQLDLPGMPPGHVGYLLVFRSKSLEMGDVWWGAVVLFAAHFFRVFFWEFESIKEKQTWQVAGACTSCPLCDFGWTQTLHFWGSDFSAVPMSSDSMSGGKVSATRPGSRWLFPFLAVALWKVEDHGRAVKQLFTPTQNLPKTFQTNFLDEFVIVCPSCQEWVYAVAFRK